MVASDNSSRKCPPTIRVSSSHPPVLVSPISVAHRKTMMANEGTAKEGHNWMRDQWVANLKKKRLGLGTPAVAAAPRGATPTKPSVRSNGGRQQSSQPTKNNGRSRPRSNKSNSTSAARTSNTNATDGEKDALTLMHPALFFNDLGCFEIESQAFMRLTPSRGRSNLDGAQSVTTTAGVASGNLSDPPLSKRCAKTSIKKRTNCFSVEVSEPKRRTPRHLNASQPSFDDFDALSSSSNGYSSVGTPSNFNAEVKRMWGPELDFPTGYVDTFLDLPTPKSAEIPIHTQDLELEQPKLIRTSSIEQEGLSHFFEQASLGVDTSFDKSSQPSVSIAVPSPTHQKRLDKPSYNHVLAAANAVDEYFGRIMPSPALVAHHHMLMTRGSGRLPQLSPMAASCGSFSPHQLKADQANDTSQAPEFETLLDEYKFTDIDQELDSFYFDAIGSIGGDLDLTSTTA